LRRLESLIDRGGCLPRSQRLWKPVARWLPDSVDEATTLLSRQTEDVIEYNRLHLPRVNDLIRNQVRL
jgi:hypothetical protein